MGQAEIGGVDQQTLDQALKSAEKALLEKYPIAGSPYIFEPQQLENSEFEAQVKSALYHECAGVIFNLAADNGSQDQILRFEIPNPYRGNPLKIKTNIRIDSCTVNCDVVADVFAGRQIKRSEVCLAEVVIKRQSGYRIDTEK